MRHATPGLGRRSASPPSPAKSRRPMSGADEFHCNSPGGAAHLMHVREAYIGATHMGLRVGCQPRGRLIVAA